MYLAVKSLLSIMLLCVSTLSTALTHHWQQSDYISRSFIAVAIGSEYGKGANKIRKWVKPLRIYVQHQAGDSQLQDNILNAHLAHLRKITTLDIRRVNSAQQANLHFFFTQQKNLKSLTTRYSGATVASYNKANTCLANIKTSPNAEVYSAQIYIPVDFAYSRGKLVACIVEEMTQALGLPRDSDSVFPSIFNDKSHNDLLTGLDETLIRILYDNEIQPGMNKNTVKSVIKNVIKKLNRRGLISEANHSAQQAPLFSMLY